MGLDLSKVSQQLTTFSKSPAARRANEYSLKNAFMYQEMEAEEQKKADEAFINTTNAIQEVEKTAKTMAWRAKDKAVLEENYKEHADSLKQTILEDFGGDITRFYQQGGKRHLQMFAMNVLNNDKAQVMAQNTAEYKKYVDVMNSGGGDKIFNSVHKKSDQYQAGFTDEFSYGVDMIPYSKPNKDELNSFPPNMSKAEVYLNTGANYNAAVVNYRNEFNKSQEEMDELAPEELINYVATYVGGNGTTNRISNTAPKLSNEISTIMTSMGNVNASDVMSLENLDTNYRKQLSALNEYAFYNPEQEMEGNVYGKEIFGDYLVELAGAFIDSDFTRANGYTEEGTVTLRDVDHSSGTMYDGVGNKLESGTAFGQGYFNSDQFEIMGAMMGYKTLGDGDERILTYDEMQEINKNGKDIKVKPVMLMAMQEESTNVFGFGDADVVYKELAFDNVVKADAFNKSVKADSKLLAAKVQENADAYNQRIDDVPVFNGLKITSAPKKLYNYALHYDRALTDKLGNLGIQKSDINTKSLLLSFAHTIAANNDDVTHDIVIDNLDKIFSLSTNPDMNDALQTNDMQVFLETYMNQRRQEDPTITQEEQQEMFAEITELASSIRNSIIETQKTK
tara:strand:- start:2850 stop:4715 length:1866 start_codon:yes stop_codon:yes gene_type:complete